MRERKLTSWYGTQDTLDRDRPLIDKYREVILDFNETQKFTQS